MVEDYKEVVDHIDSVEADYIDLEVVEHRDLVVVVDNLNIDLVVDMEAAFIF